MRQEFPKVLEAALGRICLFLFREQLGEKARQFAKFFGYLAIGEIVGSVIGFPVKILAGRFLGPVEFGKFALILSLTQFFIIPMVFGLTSGAQKYISSSRDDEDKKEIIGFVITLFLLTTVASTIFFIITKGLSVKIFGISEQLFWWTLLFSVATSVFYIFDAIIRSLKNFKLVSCNIILNSFITVLLFVILLFILGNKTYSSLTLANLLAFLASIVLLCLFLIRSRNIKFRFSGQMAKKVTHYSVLGIIGAVTGFLIVHTDRFFLNHYISLYWVGVYSAYVNASTVFVGRFFQLFLNVYFPNVSSEQNKEKIFIKLGQVLKVSILPIFLFSFFSIWFIIWLFGSKFPVRFDLLLLFSVNNCLYVFYQLYMWLLNSQGVFGMRTTLRILIVNSILNLLFFYLLIRSIGTVGAILATVFVNTIFSVYFYKKVKLFISNNYFLIQ